MTPLRVVGPRNRVRSRIETRSLTGTRHVHADTSATPTDFSATDVHAPRELRVAVFGPRRPSMVIAGPMVERRQVTHSGGDACHQRGVRWSTMRAMDCRRDGQIDR